MMATNIRPWNLGLDMLTTVSFDQLRLCKAYMRQWTVSALIQIMVCRLVGAKPLPDPILTYHHQLEQNKNSGISIKIQWMFLNKRVWKYHLPNGDHFVSASMYWVIFPRAKLVVTLEIITLHFRVFSWKETSELGRIFYEEHFVASLPLNPYWFR